MVFGKKLDTQGVALTKELITPEVARAMLNCGNPNNRKIRKSTVDAYAADMRNGMWDDKAIDPLVFDVNGILRNGHHRLHAITKSGISQACWIARGANPSNTYDLGAGRSYNDIFKTDGIEVTTNMVSAVRTIGTLLFGVQKVPVGEMQNAIKTDSENIRMITNICGRPVNSIMLCKKSSIAAAMYCAYTLGRLTEEQAIKFVEIVNSGKYNGSSEESAVVFRNKLVIPASAEKIDRRILFNITQEALLYFTKGKERKKSFRGSNAYGSEFVEKFRIGTLYDT